MRWAALWCVVAVARMSQAQSDGSTANISEIPRTVAKPAPGNGKKAANNKRKPRQVQTREECFIGEECILPDGTTFRVNQGPTPRLDRLGSQYKELEHRFDSLRAEYRPFRIGATLTPPLGDFSGLTLGVQWQPPRITERLHLLFGAGAGVAHFGGIPSGGKVRALFDGSATLNMWLGPCKAFLGLALAGASDPFDRSWLGGGPTGGYRWNFDPSFSLDVAITTPYAKPAWEEEPGWGLETQIALMWQFGGSGTKE